jgi:hypothetical protein
MFLVRRDQRRPRQVAVLEKEYIEEVMEYAYLSLLLRKRCQGQMELPVLEEPLFQVKVPFRRQMCLERGLEVRQSLLVDVPDRVCDSGSSMVSPSVDLPIP